MMVMGGDGGAGSGLGLVCGLGCSFGVWAWALDVGFCVKSGRKYVKL